MKGQDLIVLAKLFDPASRLTGYKELSESLAISASEIHAAVGRLKYCGLIGQRKNPIPGNTLDFLFSGLRYVFPFRPCGGIVRGNPTAWAAPVAASRFSASGLPPVWECANGTVVGTPFPPLYPSAVNAAENDRRLYDTLALFDIARGGRIRERVWAREELEKRLANDIG